MKLRIKGDSVRLRLTQGEVRSLEQQGAVTDAVHFTPDSKLEYRVRRDPAVETLAANFRDGLLEVRIPDGVALEWCRSQLVTLEYTRSAPEGELRLVVEKDFACLAPRAGEDESDHFPHPDALAKC